MFLVRVNEGNNIVITIRDLKDTQAKCTQLKLLFNQGHAELRTADYFQAHDVDSSSKALSPLAVADLLVDPTLYVLLEQNINHHNAINPRDDSLVERLNVLRTYHPLTRPEAAFKFVKWSLDYAKHIPQFHDYARSLCRQFPAVLVSSLLADREDVGLLALAAGVDPHGEEVSGYSLLRHTQNPTMIAALIAAGLDPNKGDSFGYTPLHYATETSAVKALLAGGANPNAGTSFGMTPLMSAVCFRDSSVDRIKALLEGGADLNKTDEDGNTALFYAKTPEEVKVLLGAGADPRIMNKVGLTADYGLLDAVASLLREAITKLDAAEQVERGAVRADEHLVRSQGRRVSGNDF